MKNTGFSLTSKAKFRASLSALSVVPNEALVHPSIVAGYPVHDESQGVRQLHLAVEIWLQRNPVSQPLDMTHGRSGYTAVEDCFVSGVGHLKVLRIFKQGVK